MNPNNTSPHLTSRLQELNPRQARFVSEYVKSGNGRAAAIAAGYSEKNAGTHAAQLLNHNAAVVAAVAEAKKVIGETLLYDSRAAMKELDDAIDFAKKTNNASAYARCTELKMKMSGLLAEKDKGAALAPFSINFVGFEKAPPAVEMRD